MQVIIALIHKCYLIYLNEIKTTAIFWSNSLVSYGSTEMFGNVWEITILLWLNLLKK